MCLRARTWAIFRCGPCNAARLSCSWPLQLWKQKPIVSPAWLSAHRLCWWAWAESSDSRPCPPRKQPLDEAALNLSLETQETSLESSYCSQAKRAVSLSRRRLRSILIRGRGVAGGSSRPGLCRLGRRLTAQDGRPAIRRCVNPAERLQLSGGANTSPSFC